MIPKWSSWVFLPVTESLTSPSQRASWRFRSVRFRAWRAFLPDSSQPKSCSSRYWVNGHRRGGRLLELEPARAQPDDRHVAVAADRRARRLADRAEAVGDGDARRDLEALAGAGAVGEAVLEGLLEAAQVVGLTERELGLGAARLDVVAGAGELGSEPAGGGRRGGLGCAGGGGGAPGHRTDSLTPRADELGGGRGGNRGNRLAPRPGRVAARPAAALFFSYSY